MELVARTWRRSGPAIVVLLGVTLSAGQALAQPAAEVTAPEAQAAQHARAREEFERGVGFAREKRWLEAERAFDTAWSLEHAPNSAINLAIVRYHLGAYASADRALDEYEATAGADVSKRAEAERLRPLLATRLARLTLRVTPAGAEVRIDGQLQPGSGVQRVIPLDPGEHVVHVTSDGHVPTARTVEVGAAEGASLAIVLAQAEVRANETEPVSPPPSAADGRVQPNDDGVLRWTGIALGAAGGAGLIAAGVLAVAAAERNSDSKASCDENDCLPAGHAARTQARALGDAASVAGLAGGALLLAGGIVWLTSRSGSEADDAQLAVSAARGGLGLELRGAL